MTVRWPKTRFDIGCHLMNASASALWSRTKKKKKKNNKNCHLVIHFPTSSGISEWASKRTSERASKRVSAAKCASEASSAEQANKCASERRSKWPSIYLWIHGCPGPQWSASAAFRHDRWMRNLFLVVPWRFLRSARAGIWTFRQSNSVFFLFNCDLPICWYAGYFIL